MCDCKFMLAAWDTSLSDQHRNLLIALEALRHVRDYHCDVYVSVHTTSELVQAIRDNNADGLQDVEKLLREAAAIYRTLPLCALSSGSSDEARRMARLAAQLR